MQPVSAFVVFIMIWWTVIFCVLPIGLSTTYEDVEHDEEGTRIAGAPKTLNIKKKMLITTLISIVLWIAICLLIQSDVIDLRALSLN